MVGKWLLPMRFFLIQISIYLLVSASTTTHSMSMEETYNFIDDITPVNEQMTLKVRIIRLWKPPGYKNPNEDNSLEMVLRDEKGRKIQASIKKRFIPLFDHLLHEGACKFISNFTSGENKGAFKMSPHLYRINFLHTTVVNACSDIPDIPIYGFDFVSFGDILGNRLDDGLLIDVIGKVVGLGSLEIIERNGNDTPKLVIQFVDTEDHNLKCTLWEKYALEANEFISNHKFDQIIGVIQFAKIKKFQGENSVTNSLYCTRIVFNPDIEETAKFRDSLGSQFDLSAPELSQISTLISLSTNELFLQVEDQKTIDEIRETTTPIKCVTVATIVCVESKNGWYYLSCKSCHKKVREHMAGTSKGMTGGATKFECEKCEKIIGADNITPKFKLQIRVIDASGSASFVMFDKEVKTLLHKSAYAIRLQNSEGADSNEVPEILQSFVGKKLIFRVEVSKFNLDQNWNVFTVLKVSEDPSLINSYMRFSTDSQETISSVGENEGSTILQTNVYDTRDFASSVTKKMKATATDDV